jgi:hypothetical protein
MWLSVLGTVAAFVADALVDRGLVELKNRAAAAEAVSAALLRLPAQLGELAAKAQGVLDAFDVSDTPTVPALNLNFERMTDAEAAAAGRKRRGEE